MQVADRFGKSTTMMDLPLTALYELAAPSTPPEVREEIERRVAAGELVSGEDVRDLKAQFKEITERTNDLVKSSELGVSPDDAGEDWPRGLAVSTRVRR
jgi:hypothetical protein